jgi:hypothetical protein
LDELPDFVATRSIRFATGGAAMGIAFAAGGSWMAYSIDQPSDVNDRYIRLLILIAKLFGITPLTALHIIGWLFILTGASVIAFFLRSIILREPSIRMTAEGLYSGDWSGTTIPWDQVQAVRRRIVAERIELLDIQLVEPRRYPATRLPGRINTSGWIILGVDGTDRYFEEMILCLSRYRPDLFEA